MDPRLYQRFTLVTLSMVALLQLSLLGLSSYSLYLGASSNSSCQDVSAPTRPSPTAQSCSSTNTNTTTVIIREVEVSKSPTWRAFQKSCPGSQFQRMLLVSSHRFGETTGHESVMINREPFVSCSKTECRQFALGHYAAHPGGYYGQTRSDRTNMRVLFSVPLGKQMTVGNSVIHLNAWSGAACHDGMEWTYAGVEGPDNAATLKIKYGQQITDTYDSYVGNILRTQESECICTNGKCYLMVTDGSASGVSEARFLKIEKGKITGVITPTGRTKYTEECSCSLTGPDRIECACRDNNFSAKRPIVKINTQTDQAEIHLMCSSTYLDTPRPTDGSIAGGCEADGSSGSGGLKGGFTTSTNSNGEITRYYTRTVSTSSRDGMEVYQSTEDPWVQASGLTKLGTLIQSGNPGWYQAGFKIPGGDCDQSCISIEMVHDGGSTTWHSAAMTVYCLTGSAATGWPSVTGVDMTL